MEETEVKRSKKGPIILIGIVALILVLLFAVPMGFLYFKSKAQCGQGGMLLGSANKGYYCGYSSVCRDCEDTSQCPDCEGLCAATGKVKREGSCGPTKIDLTGKIKRNRDGGFSVEKGPITCYCCCKGGE